MTDTIDATTTAEEVKPKRRDDHRPEALEHAMRLLDLRTGELAVLIDDLAQIIGYPHDAEWWTIGLLIAWVDSPWLVANRASHLTGMACANDLAGEAQVREWLFRLGQIERRQGLDHHLRVAPVHRIEGFEWDELVR